MKDVPNDIDVQSVLDVTGLICPEPVMMLHNKIKDCGIGDVLKIIATDPSTQRDIPKFCEFLGHKLIADDIQNETFLYFIRKG